MRLNDARDAVLDDAAQAGASPADLRELANAFRAATAERASDPD